MLIHVIYPIIKKRIISHYILIFVRINSYIQLFIQVVNMIVCDFTECLLRVPRLHQPSRQRSGLQADDVLVQHGAVPGQPERLATTQRDTAADTLAGAQHQVSSSILLFSDKTHNFETR